MSLFGRQTIKSQRTRMRRVERAFEVTWNIFLVVYALFAFAIWLSHRPSLQVATVVVEGVAATDGNAIAHVATDALNPKILGRLNRNNSVLYQAHKVEDELLALDARIKTARATFDSRKQLHVTITEYVPSLLYCQASQVTQEGEEATTTQSIKDIPLHIDQCYFADDRGYIFAPAPEYNAYPFLVFISTQKSEVNPLRTFAFTKASYDKVTTFLDGLKSDRVTAKTVMFLDASDVRITSRQHGDILWSTERDPKKSADNLALVISSLSSDNGVHVPWKRIDLRFGSKIFYRQ